MDGDYGTTLATQRCHMNEERKVDMPPELGAPYHGNDPINNPAHYNSSPSGIEAIQFTEHMGFNLGNAAKYLYRSGKKDDAVQDLRKAVWYTLREIRRIILFERQGNIFNKSNLTEDAFKEDMAIVKSIIDKWTKR